MNQFDKVVKFINDKKVFTRKQFERKFGPYPNTESTYLRYLVTAGYVANPFLGAFARTKTKAFLRDVRIIDVMRKNKSKSLPEFQDYGDDGGETVVW